LWLVVNRTLNSAFNRIIPRHPKQTELKQKAKRSGLNWIKNKIWQVVKVLRSHGLRGKAPRACENMPPTLTLFVRFAAKSAACSLSATLTGARCGYRRAEFEKSKKQKLSPRKIY